MYLCISIDLIYKLNFWGTFGICTFRMWPSKVPQLIKSSYIISSEGCTHREDRLLFSKQRYNLLGARYTQAYVKAQGIDLQLFDMMSTVNFTKDGRTTDKWNKIDPYYAGIG